MGENVAAFEREFAARGTLLKPIDWANDAQPDDFREGKRTRAGHIAAAFDLPTGDLPRLVGRLLEVGPEVIGERFCRLALEEAAVRIGQPGRLRLDRRNHPRMTVPETGHRRAAAGIEIALAVAIDDFDALAAHGDRVSLLGLAMEDVAHQRTL